MFRSNVVLFTSINVLEKRDLANYLMSKLWPELGNQNKQAWVPFTRILILLEPPQTPHEPHEPFEKAHSKSKRSVLAPKCWFSSIGPGADLTLRGAILSIWSKSTPIKTIAAPSKTVLAHRRNCFSHVMRIGPFHKSHFYSKNRDISGFSLVGPYLGLTWPILIELFRPHDNAKWLDH